MATTTNYGWETPDDTDLVKDGAAAIRTLGSSVDTTVFNNASAGIPKTIVDAKGDIIAATAADTVSRLAVGTNDQVLLADSTTATGLKWGNAPAGGMTLLSTSTLSGASTTISSIDQTYTDLFIVVNNLYISSSNDYIIVRPNAGTNNGLYSGHENNTNTQLSEIQTTKPSESSSGLNSFIIKISQYSNTSFSKPTTYYGVSKASTSDRFFGNGAIVTTSAITSMQFVTAGYGATFSGGTVLIYGVK